MIIRIHKINVWSAFKVGCLMTLIPTAIFAFGLLVLGILGIHLLAGNLGTLISSITAAPLLALLVGGLYSIGPAIAFAIQASLYNTVARFFGGLELNLERRAYREVDLGSGPQRVKATVPPQPFNPAMPTNSQPGDGRFAMHDEIATLNKQIKERQARINEVNAHINREPK